MDMEKFNAGLSVLLAECGAELSVTPQIILSRPEREGFVGESMELDACKAVRERQPVEIRITARATICGEWHHVSGDDRRLHPDLRSNLNSTTSNVGQSGEDVA